MRAAGDYYLAISLGPNTATFAENPAVGVVLRVEVAGTELAGPQKDAPAAADTPDEAPAAGAGAEEAPPVKDTAAAEKAGWPSPWVLAAAGGALALLVVAAAALVARRRAGRGAGGPTRGGTA